ncbi:MAG: aromatic amino acid lyase, partial [Polyangiaceae bacterium]
MKRDAHEPLMLGGEIRLEDLESVARGRRKVALSPETRAKIDASRGAIDRIAEAGDAAPHVYGVNTGFGHLSETRISATDIRALQRNLVRSHSTGVGNPLSIAETRGMMLLRAQVIALGHSGARSVLVDLLIEMLNRGVHPRVPSQGSVGASGDLAPLAHLALTMIGEGEASFDPDGDSESQKGAEYTRIFLPSADCLKKAALQQVSLEAKEGLALINGTQMMASVGALA